MGQNKLARTGASTSSKECTKIKEQIEFKISTKEMNAIMQCVEARYEARINELVLDLDTYKMQVSNLLKEKSRTK